MLVIRNLLVVESLDFGGGAVHTDYNSLYNRRRCEHREGYGGDDRAGRRRVRLVGRRRESGRERWGRRQSRRHRRHVRAVLLRRDVDELDLTLLRTLIAIPKTLTTLSGLASSTHQLVAVAAHLVTQYCSQVGGFLEVESSCRATEKR